MSSSKYTSSKMNSITRRFVTSYTTREIWGIVVSSLLIFILALGVYIIATEHSALGFFSINTLRSFDIDKDSSGKVVEVIYKLSTESGQAEEVGVYKPLRVITGICSGVFALRLLLLFVIGIPLQNRKIRKMLSPLNELALRADELSRIEFGEDKYQLIEDAISHLDGNENSSISLGDRELLGVEAAINNLLVRVRESNRQQARFVNDASHELRTPIAVISGYADMLSRWGKDDEKVLEESIDAIQKESTRMKHLVEQLLFLARGDSGKTALRLEDTNLTELIKEAYEESIMIDEAHVYRLKLPENQVPTIQADPGLLKQAVRVLIDNAAKYTKAHDEIILSVGVSEGRPFIQVQDSGIGMAEADVSHMFERFYRADEARSFEGTGLGLSIAKWIVDKHGGHFEILSRPDLGTRIKIVL